MALIGFEGFDHVSTGSPMSDLIYKPFGSGLGSSTGGTWIRVNTGTNLLAAGQLGGYQFVNQTEDDCVQLATLTYPRLLCGARIKINSLPCDVFLFFDQATIQCGLSINSSGNMFLWRGTLATVVATGTYTFTVGYYYVEADITVNNTTGACSTRVAGTTADISVSGVNTRNTANNQLNRFSFIGNQFTSNLAYIDDFYVIDPSTGSPTTWLGVVRVETLFPTAPSAAPTWTPATNVEYVFQGLQNSALNLATGNCYYTRIHPAQGGTITAIITRFTASITGHVQCAIYDATGASGGPGSLLATSTTTLTNPVGNATWTLAPEQTFNFAGLALTAGTYYWLALLCDATMNPYCWGSGTSGSAFQAQAYGSGFPATASGVSIGFPVAGMNPVYLVATYTGSNALNVAETSIDYDTSYNVVPVGANQDTFLHGALSSTPATIYAVAVSASVRKDDVTVVTAQTTLISGGTTQQGATQSPSSSYLFMRDIYQNDPNTSAAWTGTAVNAAAIGYNRIT